MSTCPFDYDLHQFTIPGTNGRTLVCCHGHGGNYQFAEKLKNLGWIESTLVSFNFPDHDLHQKVYDPQTASFGTIQELLPPLYVLKKCVIDQGYEAIDLYGRSAGGGAVVNLIAVLNASRYTKELEKIGIGKDEKKSILRALQNGVVIFDVPLKSVEEIIDLRGSSSELQILAKKYRDSQLRPIDSLLHLEGLSLNVILRFQDPDEIIFNRDDEIFIERLKKANHLGTTSVIIGDEGGHMGPSEPLWTLYAEKAKNLSSKKEIGLAILDGGRFTHNPQGNTQPFKAHFPTK